MADAETGAGFRTAAELEPLLGDVGVCVPRATPAPGIAAALWLGCVDVDAIATDPAGAPLSRAVVERLLKAKELITAIPAKPPVAVTLRARERRR